MDEIVASRHNSDSEAGNHTKTDGKTFWETNRIIKKVFTCLGIYLLKWDEEDEKYKVRNKLFVSCYIFWFIWPLIGILLAFTGSVIFGIDSDITDYLEEENGFLISIPLYILLLAFIPANQTYAISIFSKMLPSILQQISILSNTSYGTFRHDKEIDINLLKMYSDGKETTTKLSMKWLQKWLPEATFIFAFLAFLASTIYSIVEITSKGSVFQEWYFIVMVSWYQVMPICTTWFCMIFIEWHRRVYENICNKIDHKDDEDKKYDISNQKLTALNVYSDKIQDIFIQLNEGVFNYPLGVNMLVYIATSTFCTSRILSDPEYIYYVFPLGVTVAHIVFLCARCSDLLEEHRKVLLILNDIQQTLVKQEKHGSNPHQARLDSLDKLRANLLESPPKVEILGSSFTVDYGMLSTIFGFVLSYALVINEVFEDDTVKRSIADPSDGIATMAVTPIHPQQ